MKVIVELPDQHLKKFMKRLGLRHVLLDLDDNSISVKLDEDYFAEKVGSVEEETSEGDGEEEPEPEQPSDSGRGEPAVEVAETARKQFVAEQKRKAAAQKEAFIRACRHPAKEQTPREITIKAEPLKKTKTKPVRQNKYATKKCPICEQTFSPKSGRTVYCPQCIEAFGNKCKDKAEEAEKEREYKRLHPTFDHVCLICHKHFTDGEVKTAYCPKCCGRAQSAPKVEPLKDRNVDKSTLSNGLRKLSVKEVMDLPPDERRPYAALWTPKEKAEAIAIEKRRIRESADMEHFNT